MRRRGKTGRKSALLANLFARFGVMLAALALLSQSLAVAAHPAGVPHDIGAAAAELRALFGPDVVICTQDDDSGAPTQPPHNCNDCPLCQLAASALALDMPAPAGLVALAPTVESKLALPQPPPQQAPAPSPSPLPRGPPSAT